MTIRFTSILYKKNQKRRTQLIGTVLIGSQEYIFSGDAESHIRLMENKISMYALDYLYPSHFVDTKVKKGYKRVDLDKCNYKMKWPNAISKIECEAIAITLKK